MPGIDRNRVIGKDSEDLDELTCGICRGVFVNPMSTPCCRQTYCKDCIDEWLTEHNTCPHDRTELTSDGLIRLARFVLNLIDKTKIRCAYNEKGCPSVHTIAQDSEHLKVCEFARCGHCGLQNPEPNHNCLTYLLNVNLNLCEDNRKLKTLNKDLVISVELMREEVQKVKTDLDVKSKEWFEEKFKLNDKIFELHKEAKHYKTIALSVVIIQAQKHSGSVEECFGFSQGWQQIINHICEDTIKKFDSTKHIYLDLVNTIKSRIDERAYDESNWQTVWTVTITGIKVPVDLNTKNYFLRLLFGSLIIDISAE